MVRLFFIAMLIMMIIVIAIRVAIVIMFNLGKERLQNIFLVLAYAGKQGKVESHLENIHWNISAEDVIPHLEDVIPHLKYILCSLQ